MKLALFCTLAFLSTWAYGGQALKLNGSGASTAVVTGDPDTGEPLVDRGLSNAVSTGSLGKTHTSGRSKLGDWDSSTFCEYAPGVIGVLLVYESATNIDTAANGDQLFRRMSASPDSTLCFDFIDLRFTFTIYTDIVGGTGRFAGASGTAVTTGSGSNIDDGHSAFQFSLEGELD